MKRNVCSSRQRTCLFIVGRSLKVTLWSFTWLSTVLRDLSTYNLFMQILKAHPRRPVEKELLNISVFYYWESPHLHVPMKLFAVLANGENVF